MSKKGFIILAIIVIAILWHDYDDHNNRKYPNYSSYHYNYQTNYSDDSTDEYSDEPTDEELRSRYREAIDKGNYYN